MEFLRFLIDVFILCVIIRYAPPLLSNFCGEFMAFWFTACILVFIWEVRNL